MLILPKYKETAMSKPEKVVDDNFWHNKWGNNQIGFHQEKVNSRLKKFWPQLSLPEGSRVFVPLCGKSLDMCWLAQRHSVLGVELSDIAIRDFFSEQDIACDITGQASFTCYSGGRLSLWCGDFFALTSDDLNGVTGVFDRAFLVTLPTPLRKRYAQHLADILQPGCKILLITMIYDQNKMSGPPFSIPEGDVAVLFSEHFAREKITESSGPDIIGNLSERGLDILTEQVFVLTRR